MLGNIVSNEIKHKINFLIGKLNLKNNISILGRVKNVEDYYQKARVLILPSLCEGYSLVTIEAKSYGIPVVLYSLPYIENISEEDGCFTVKRFDILNMAKYVINLMNDDNLWNKYSTRAYNSIAEKNDSIIEKWIQLFKNLEVGEELYFNKSNTVKNINKISMTEFNYAIEKFINFKQNYLIRPEIIRIAQFIDFLLPNNSYRLKIVKKIIYICKLLLKKINQN